MADAPLWGGLTQALECVLQIYYALTKKGKSNMTVYLQNLEDRYQIVDALHRFANGMDADDETLIRSAFTEDAVADFTPAAAKVGMQFPVLDGRKNITDALVPFADAYETSHSVTNTRVEVNGDIAVLEALVEAQHLPIGDRSRHFMMMNNYRVELHREGAVWCISRMSINNIWSDGDVSIMTGG
jgi:ketosteroid isomerase-like protein